MDRDLHKRRFRGAALFIIVINTFALLLGLLLLGADTSEQGVSAGDIIAGAAIVILPAVMTLNGSVFGGVILLILLTAEFVLEASEGAGINWPTIRSVLFIGLAAWIVSELIRYRIRSHEEAEPIGGSAVIRWGGKGLIAAGAAALAVMASGNFMQSAPGRVLTAQQIPGEQYSWMVNNNILGSAERVFYFSEDSGVPYTESGNLLTDHYIGAWWQEEGELETGWIRIGEICRVEKTRTASDVAENMYTIYTFGEESWLRILLPKADGGDKTFMARMNYLNDEKMHSEVRSACDENREPDWDIIAAGNGIQNKFVGPEDVSQSQLSWLRHNDFLSREETLLKFYANGHYSVSSGGLLLTDLYFGGWSEDTDGLHGWWFKFGEICDVRQVKDATKTRGPLYRIESQDQWFEFHLPEEGDQDTELIADVTRMNAVAQSEETATACAAFMAEKDAGEE